MVNDEMMDKNNSFMGKRRYYKLLPLMLLLLVFGFGAYAQIAKDSLSLLVEQEVDTQLDEKLKPLKFLLGISVATLSVLGVFMWFYRIKKIANEVVEKRVSSLVEKQIAEKFGVKMKTLQRLLKEAEERHDAVAQKRLVVVNKSAGKRIALERLIEEAGFPVSDSKRLAFMTLEAVKKESIKTNDFDVLLIDNSDEQLQEAEITWLMNDYEGQLRLVCFTKADLKNYAELSKKAKIVKMEERLGQALIDAAK